MISPTNRLWLFLASETDVEIVLLGDVLSNAPTMADLHQALEHCQGFENVRPLVMGAQVIGFRATRSANATYIDPIAEAMLLLRRYPRIEWCGSGGNRAGNVGTW